MIEEHLTRSVLGAFYASYNKLGYGFVENVCVGGLMIELQRRGHKTEREVPIAVYYDGVIVGTYRIDLVVDGTLLIEVKAEAKLTTIHERQLRNYLCCTEYEVGLVLSYGRGSRHAELSSAGGRTPGPNTALRVTNAPLRRRSP